MLLRIALVLALLLPFPAEAEKSDCLIQKRRIAAVLEKAQSCNTYADCMITNVSCFGCDMALNGKQNEISDVLGGFEHRCEQSCAIKSCEETPKNMRVRCQNHVCETYLQKPPETITDKSEDKGSAAKLNKEKEKKEKEEKKASPEEEKKEPAPTPAPVKKSGPIIIN